MAPRMHMIERLPMYAPIVMQRWGGHPYWDGQFWRCTECNGLVENGECRTCGAVPSRRKGINSWSAQKR